LRLAHVQDLHRGAVVRLARDRVEDSLAEEGLAAEDDNRGVPDASAVH
jgi:hypothetical protein